MSIKKYRVKRVGGEFYVYPPGCLQWFAIEYLVQVKVWYGWTTIKRFSKGDFEEKRAHELLDLLNEEL